jgi:cell division protein FtsB
MEQVQTIIEWFQHNRRKLATVAVGVLSMMVGWHVLFGANGMVAYQHKKAEFQRLQVEMQTLETENQELQQKVERLRSDPKTIEREAREQLRYARPGEIVYTVPAPVSSDTTPTVTAKKR